MPVAVIGVGHLGRHHARLLKQVPGVELVAVVDSRPEQARAVAADLGVPALASVEQLPAEVCAVSVAVPTSLHHAIVCPLLERGIHVLVEKPMAATLEQGRAMAQLAAEHGVVLQVGHVERFNPALGALSQLEIVPRFVAAERLAPFTFRALDVSVVMDLMIHDIDIVMDLAGAPLLDVRAVGSAVLGRKVDIANARLEFANGCVANLTASRVSFEPVRRMRVFGSDAYVSLDFNVRRAFVVRKAPGFELASLSAADAARFPPKASFKEFIGQGLLDTRTIDMDEANPLLLQLTAFVQAVRSGRATGGPRVATAEEGLRAMEVATGIGELIAGRPWDAVSGTARELPSFPALPEEESLEARVQADWDAHDVRGRALRHNEDAPRSFVFYEGPPTANGRPGLHHVFARTLKDVICRHRLMAGFRVPRKAGWDTQGLPVEIEVQKTLGITTRDEILRLAADKRASIVEFNRLCRESVFRYVDEWKRLSLRMAYWLDYEHPYVTCEREYIESGWAILAKIHGQRGADGHSLLRKDFKVLWYCPRCQTGLSNHEVALGYEDVQDPSVYVRFRVTPEAWKAQLDRKGFEAGHALRALAGPLSLLVWTTTPWTLPSNVAVAAREQLEYEIVKHGEEFLIVGKERTAALFGKNAEHVAAFSGLLLEGLRYDRPLALVPMAKGEHACEVRLADYVSADDGTGLVHTAPAFGTDDFSLRQRDKLPLLRPVDDAGKFTSEVATDDFGRTLVGRFVKDADKDIIRELKSRGLLFKQDTLQHSYPHCWRCSSPLLSMARPSWYVRTTAVRDRMVELNAQIDWHPPEMGTGRFGEWLANNVDWAISRDRFWGTPLNVWICDSCHHERAPVSLAQLGEWRGEPLAADFDPHKPQIDEVTAPCDQPGCKGTSRRTPEVVDCWFDSGAMPFAQAGWPAATGGALPRDFPADYISEGLDQTRGWFYTLHALSTLVADSAAYRSVLVGNLLLDAQGKKMSKSRGNAVDPWALFEQCGVDAVRWFFLSSGQVWTPKRFDPKVVTEGARRSFGTLRNCYAFLALYANMDGWAPGAEAPPVARRAGIDRWLVSRLQTLTRDVGAAYEAYDLTEATRLLDAFIDAELSNWYVRRNRARFWKGADDADKRAAFATLAEALQRVSLLLAPITPFLAEWLWHATTGASAASSVHLQDWPAADAALVDEDLERRMAVVLRAVELGRSVRAEHDLKTRQPLAAARIKAADPRDAARLREPELSRLVAEELNVRAVEVVDRADFRTLSAKPDWKRLGPRLGPKLKAVGAAVAQLGEGVLDAFAESGRLQLRVEGEMLDFDREDIVLTEKGREGFAVAAGSGLLLALDTRLDDDLIAEGRAREIVNRVQNARKSAGLDVSDRIVLRLAGSEDLLAAARRHEKLILAEVLGTRLEVGKAPAGAQEFDVDGAKLAVGVEKAG